VTTATAHCRAALVRQETRGSHNRLDFPELDNHRWRVRLLVDRSEGGMVVSREEIGE